MSARRRTALCGGAYLSSLLCREVQHAAMACVSVSSRSAGG